MRKLTSASVLLFVLVLANLATLAVSSDYVLEENAWRSMWAYQIAYNVSLLILLKIFLRNAKNAERRNASYQTASLASITQPFMLYTFLSKAPADAMARGAENVLYEQVAPGLVYAVLVTVACFILVRLLGEVFKTIWKDMHPMQQKA